MHKGASACSEVPKAPDNKGDSDKPHEAPTSPAVHDSASNMPAGGHRSGKQNDKQNDKRAAADPDLAKVIDAWADLPEVVKTGMLAMVEASRART